MTIPGKKFIIEGNNLKAYEIGKFENIVNEAMLSHILELESLKIKYSETNVRKNIFGYVLLISGISTFLAINLTTVNNWDFPLSLNALKEPKKE